MVSPPRITSDYLVIGSGIAGLSFALRAAERGTVTLFTKKDQKESATNYAQGGIASVVSRDDSFEEHIRDTLAAGDGLCHEDAVRTVVTRGPEAIEALLRWGVRFTPGAATDAPYDLGREGGHSRRRILHHLDRTGREIERALAETAAAHANIRVLEHLVAIDLITSGKLGLPGEDRCLGVYALDPGRDEVFTLLARATMVATGGAGKVYLYTSNPDISTGDGIAMAYRARAVISNMEFIQFHPTCLFHPEAKNFLISEAVRGEGGVLKRRDGTSFMKGVHPMADLAPRDIVARAIDRELKESGDAFILLDVSHRGEDFVRQRFPTLHARCLEFGYDMARKPIPVVPAAHYVCGGIRTDLGAETTLPGLFACGETACTGVHGANRLASNSLLEAVVFAEAAASRAAERLPDLPEPPAKVPDWVPAPAVAEHEAVNRAQRQAARPRPAPHRAAPGRDQRVLLARERHPRHRGASKHRHRRGADHSQRDGAQREPRPALHARSPGVRPDRRAPRHAHSPRRRLPPSRPGKGPPLRGSPAGGGALSLTPRTPDDLPKGRACAGPAAAPCPGGGTPRLT
jgi:L-aspartate oxidase